MKTMRNLPGARTALAAFFLTVLLGVGVTSAAGLWQQSATTTMTVAWPDTPMSLQCAASGDSVAVTILNIPSPTAVSVASRMNGTATYGSATAAPASTTFTVSANSYGIPQSVGSNKIVKVDLRVSATYNGGSGTAELLGLQLTGNNSKLACP
jgi:hypothetical protein